MTDIPWDGQQITQPAGESKYVGALASNVDDNVGPFGASFDLQPGGGPGGGHARLVAGDGGSESAMTGGDALIVGGSGNNWSANPAQVIAKGGSAAGDGGDVLLAPGACEGTGRHGLVIVGELPDADPQVAGALWADAGVVKVSAG